MTAEDRVDREGWTLPEPGPRTPRPPLEAFIEARDTEELRATIRLCHRTIAVFGRLGWMQASWSAPFWRSTAGHGGPSPEPLILAALCVAMGEELIRRNASALVCASCRHALEVEAWPVVTTPATDVATSPSESSGGGR
jgi:hypothetical protein